MPIPASGMSLRIYYTFDIFACKSLIYMGFLPDWISVIHSQFISPCSRPETRQVGEAQGQHSGQGGAPLQGDQMPVRLSQDSVSGLGQKHGSTDHAVCAEQLVDGEKTNDSGACGMSAPAAWANAQKQAQRGQPTGVKSLKWVNQKKMISSGELLSINSRFCGGYSELP